jgi:protein TonB
MNKLLILFILFSVSLNAQVQNSPVAVDTTVYTIVDKTPKFPKGSDAMYKFIYSKVNFERMSEIDVQGKIFIQFVIEKDGSISNIKITRSLDPFCDKEAIRIVRLMPKWEPGKLNNKIVRTKIEVPITIKFE